MYSKLVTATLHGCSYSMHVFPFRPHPLMSDKCSFTVYVHVQSCIIVMPALLANNSKDGCPPDGRHYQRNGLLWWSSLEQFWLPFQCLPTVTCKHPMFVQPFRTACRLTFFACSQWLVACNLLSEREGLEIETISWNSKHFPWWMHAHTHVHNYTMPSCNSVQYNAYLLPLIFLNMVHTLN